MRSGQFISQKSLCSLEISVPDTGSTSQRYGSGSFYHHEKKNKKNLESYYFVTLFDFLSLKNNVNVPSKSNKHKKLCKKISFLLASWRSMTKHCSKYPSKGLNIIFTYSPQKIIHHFQNQRLTDGYYILGQIYCYRENPAPHRKLGFLNSIFLSEWLWFSLERT